jgi:hypothetical protein
MDTRDGGGGIRIEPIDRECAYCGSTWLDHEHPGIQDMAGRWFCDDSCRETKKIGMCCLCGDQMSKSKTIWNKGCEFCPTCAAVAGIETDEDDD